MFFFVNHVNSQVIPINAFSNKIYYYSVLWPYIVPGRKKITIFSACVEVAVHRSSVCHLNISTGTVWKESNICLICYAFYSCLSHTVGMLIRTVCYLDVVLVLHLERVLATAVKIWKILLLFFVVFVCYLKKWNASTIAQQIKFEVTTFQALLGNKVTFIA